jgi:His/Glu/Gln/Arg/opine family amino acid ABC transporter permease subunit
MSDLQILAFGSGWGDQLLFGLELTLELAVLSFVIGTAIGLAAALGELCPVKPVAVLVVGYGAVFRSVPELLVIFLVYYGGAFALGAGLHLIGIRTYVEVDAFSAGVASLSIIQGAYTSEVFRGAILAVPTGMIDAARSLGMSRFRTFRRITLPIALRYAFPGLCNMWMVVIKNTPFVSAIGLQDLIRVAGTAGQNTRQYFTFYMVVLISYLGIAGVTLLLQSQLDRRLFRHALRVAED